MLPARAASEIGTRTHQNARPIIRLSVQDEIRVCARHRVFTKRMEQRILQTRPLDRLQELLRDDHISVHVLNRQRRGNAFDRGERGHGRGRVRAGQSLRGPLVPFRYWRWQRLVCEKVERVHHLDRSSITGVRCRCPANEFSNICQFTSHRSGSSHSRTQEMSPPTSPLATFKVPVGRTRAALHPKQPSDLQKSICNNVPLWVPTGRGSCQDTWSTLLHASPTQRA